MEKVANKVEESDFDRAREQSIIQQCIRGDTNAFSEIVKKYQDRLYNAVYRLVNNSEDALDICQDVFVKAFKNINHFRGDASFITYLCSIAFNESVTYRNKRKRVKESIQNTENRIQDCQTEESGAQEQSEYIQKALDSLTPPELKEVVVLKDIEGLSYAEVAKALNISVATVRTNLDKARQILRRELRSLL